MQSKLQLGGRRESLTEVQDDPPTPAWSGCFNEVDMYCGVRVGLAPFMYFSIDNDFHLYNHCISKTIKIWHGKGSESQAA